MRVFACKHEASGSAAMQCEAAHCSVDEGQQPTAATPTRPEGREAGGGSKREAYSISSGSDQASRVSQDNRTCLKTMSAFAAIAVVESSWELSHGRRLNEAVPGRFSSISPRPGHFIGNETT